jgi:hypothetical protein
MLYFAPVRFALTVILLLHASALLQAASGPQLHLQPRPPEGWPRLSAPGQTGMVYTVQASTNLSSWTPIATTHDAVVEYPDAAAPLFPERFYRLTGTNQTAADDWKNQVTFPGDAFLSPFGEAIGPDFRWIKFAIPFNEPYRIYYQDSRKYPFHYDFATARLEGFRGMTPAQFDQVALRTNQQQILLGTLLIPPAPVEGEYGIQFVGQDAYPPALVAQYYDLVKATVVGNSNANAFYVPAFEQMPSAETNRAYFESKGIRLATAERWVSGDDIYSTGWALGRLKFVPGAEINAAFRDGRLAPGDILLTDGVPAEIPVLAGVLTLTPSTPNSHVAILSKSFGLPFAYISDADLRARVQELVGKDIVLRLDPFRFQIKVTELEPSMDPALRAEILSLRLPPKLSITPKAKYGKISASTDALTPADIQYFGGKASNFGFLRRQIPDRSPSAIALSFDLWTSFWTRCCPAVKRFAVKLTAGCPNTPTLRTPRSCSRTLPTSGHLSRARHGSPKRNSRRFSRRCIHSTARATFVFEAPPTWKTVSSSLEPGCMTVSAGAPQTTRTKTPMGQAAATQPRPMNAAYSAPSKKSTRAFTTTTPCSSVSATRSMSALWAWLSSCTTPLQMKRSWPMVWRRSKSRAAPSLGVWMAIL